MSKLEAQQREVVVLRLYSEMRFGEIARVQGESVNTIKSRYPAFFVWPVKIAGIFSWIPACAGMTNPCRVNLPANYYMEADFVGGDFMLDTCLRRYDNRDSSLHSE